MSNESEDDYTSRIAELARERGCSLRTAARLIRQNTLSKSAQHRQAVEVAAHADWGNKTDIALDVRDLAEHIKNHGAWKVPNSYRNEIAKKMPRSLRFTNS